MSETDKEPRYRIAAARKVAGFGQVVEHGSVMVMNDAKADRKSLGEGAFVEVAVWVSRAEVEAGAPQAPRPRTVLVVAVPTETEVTFSGEPFGVTARQRTRPFLMGDTVDALMVGFKGTRDEAQALLDSPDYRDPPWAPVDLYGAREALGWAVESGQLQVVEPVKGGR